MSKKTLTSGKIIISMALIITLFTISVRAAKNNIKVLFLGDSITAGYGIDKHKAYPTLLEELLKQAGKNNISIINAGISGSTTASTLSRLRWYKKIKPDILFLALGGNDGLRGLSAQEMQKNLEKSIQYALKHNMKVVLAGMQIPPNYGPEYTTEFKKVYQKLAEKYDIIFMPFLLKDVAGLEDLNLPDGIHPNTKGHEIIASHVLEYILECL